MKKVISVTAEMQRFCYELRQINRELLSTIVPLIRSKHSIKTLTSRTEKGEVVHSKYRLHIQDVSLQVKFQKSFYYDLDTDQESIKEEYSLWTAISAKREGKESDYNIVDGSIDLAVWQFIKDKFNWDDYPNFKKPQFN